ncbi:hypothetical protein POM88_024682 [Heracleum sosnowskyi]|uniref:non-specific serine/threonine protein kinase n=1 Tax=Heracleum sosnowskyi TaxID=360622 RepID=A0AAD8I4X5_9APIA|nr:hypothetical protein POM88_024682 [Heracleum sosnowskyi]
MSYLNEIILYNNSLQGGIPQEVDRLFRLEVLRLGQNALEGKIPKTLGRVNRLVILELFSNKLYGKIPTSAFNLSSLKVFNLANNQLQGSIPSDIGSTLPNLEKIQLSYNNFTGNVPISLSNASKLQAIGMQYNNFSGPVSVDFGRLLYLQKLSLANNNLEFGKRGQLSFLDSLVNCSRLNILDLGANNFRGSLPLSIANLSNELTMISLADNQISGSIPSEICKFTNLIFLSLAGNKFTGIIPSEIVKLSKLQRVVLSNNRLAGNIPASIGNLSMLDEIYLENNELSGTIPLSFGRCPMLVLLDLSQNNLTGTIPDKLFDFSPFSVKLNLSRNHLVGSLPPHIGALETIVELDVSENELSGLIPDTLGGCITLGSLYMQGNFIQGNIPHSIKGLKGMQYIDLSRNHLSGNLPAFFETLPLKYSNLSWNKFEGEVPTKGVFTNASTFSVVGNKGLCGGIPELQLPKCDSDRSHKHKMSWIQVLILIGSILILLAISYISHILLRRREKEREPVSHSQSNTTVMKVSYELLRQATKGFSRTNLVSEGGFGSLYKGELVLNNIGIPGRKKTAVAIKVFNTSHETAVNCFINEFQALKNIGHSNIVRIKYTCSSTVEKNHEFKAIVYDFMEHGSLERWLRSTSQTSPDKLNMPRILNLCTRINIANDVASALNYLHTQLDNPLIHCNLNACNIWLDTNMTAHLSNFGLAKFLTEIDSNSRAQILTGAAGTPGYIPPEYDMGRIMSTKVDVYSYGILLLEMLTGKKTTDPMFHEGFKLQNFVSNTLANGGVKEIIDPAILHELSRDDAAQVEDCLSMLFNIGVKCASELPQFRPEISDVLSMLETFRIILQISTGSSETNANKSSPPAAVLTAQRNMKSLLTKKMAPTSSTISMLPSVTVSYMDLHKATNGLCITHLVGAGGYGSVYKGIFHQEYGRLLLQNSGIEDESKTTVAIKQLNWNTRNCRVYSSRVWSRMQDDNQGRHIQLWDSITGDADNNQLRGSLPSEIGSTLPNLQKFQLSYNNFTGSIPVSLSNASKLQAIDFQSNNLSGPISVDFGRLLYLQILRLSNNNLGYGEQGHLIFLDTLTNCSSLRILELGTNNFQGSLPRSIANLSSELTIISLADNQISGSIPSEISKYINLIFLSLERNKFTGIIPPEIVRLGKLQRVLLSNNRLSGNIPASIGNLSLLDEIHFEDNELHGTIPPSFGNCPMLVLLDLSQNHLSGTLPNKFFDISPFSVKLNLSRNHLVGSLPADIGALKTLVALDVSENEFSGLIPDTLDGCITLGSLYMQGNFIQGDISQSMKKLRGMQYVDLSRNNLSGEIPIFFETLSLIYLNLSWNNLEGEVHTKGLFANASAFSVAGNKRLCGGILELQLARCSSDRSHNHKMSWVRVVIFIGSIIVILTIGFLLYLSRIKKPHPESDISISPIRLSYSQLREATNGFLWTNIISRGDSGLVYKGKLGKQYHKADIAIKILNLGIKMNIAIDVASALDYLHNQLTNPLVYCNLKPSNILLDTDMRAHVSNFGLAKFEFSGTSFSSIDGLLEMTGYVPPEYGLGGMVSLSTKGDVYSYGIFLLEMLTGKKTTDPMFHEGFTLQNFVSSALCDGVKEIIDPVNLHELTRHDTAKTDDCLSMLFNIGLECALECPQFRPDISDTLSVLEKVRIIFKGNTGRTRAYARKRGHAAVLKTQNNVKSLLMSEKMTPISASIMMLPSVTVSYMDLHKATNGLSLTNLVGAGGFGSVYKGTFHQASVRLLLRNSGIEDGIGTAVAIKVFNLQRRDFGLATSLPVSLNPNQSNSSTGLRGTTGYIAPEYGLGCKMTTKGDTYSFGILLLEMLTGIRPTHRMFRGGLNLHNFVSLALPNDVINITDPLMKVMTSVNEGDAKRVEEYLTRMFNIGLACSKPLQKDRPDMRAVLCELESIRNNL